MFHLWGVPAGIGWWMAFAGVWVVLFWGGIIALIVGGITRLSRRNGSTPERSPLDVAKERYAEGEISKEEFARIKKDLSWLLLKVVNWESGGKWLKS